MHARNTTNTSARSLAALTAVALVAASSAAVAADGGLVWDWGSDCNEARDAGLRLNIGSMFSVSGHVDETFRAYYKATGQNEKQALAESYSLDDFNVETPYYTFGFQYDCRWKWWAFKWETTFFDISSDAVAKRDYYIGTSDDIAYGGKKYDHMKIPKGTAFSLDAICVMNEAMFSFTPVSFYGGDSLKITPSVDLGLVLIGGKYGIDAGAPRGTTVYQNPPVDFVVCGDSSGFVGAGAPKIGFGAELTVGADGGVQWISGFNLGYFSYSGSSKPFTSAKHREKELDLTYLGVGLETGLLIPLETGSSLELGVRLEFTSFDGEINSKYTDAAEIISARERFDKAVDFKMSTAMVYLGLAF